MAMLVSGRVSTIDVVCSEALLQQVTWTQRSSHFAHSMGLSRHTMPVDGPGVFLKRCSDVCEMTTV